MVAQCHFCPSVATESEVNRIKVPLCSVHLVMLETLFGEFLAEFGDENGAIDEFRSYLRSLSSEEDPHGR